VCGVLLLAYSVHLTVYEFILLNVHVPLHDLEGMDVSESVEAENIMVYNPLVSVGTAVLTVLLTAYMLQSKSISNGMAVFVISSCVGKITAMGLKLVPQTATTATGPAGTADLIKQAVLASLILATVFAPPFILKPVHIKSTAPTPRMKRNLGPAAKQNLETSSHVQWNIIIYSLFLLPAMLVLSIPSVIKPLMMVISSSFGEMVAPKASELIGFSISLWGFAVLSMTSNYLPEGGGDIWKKISALTLLVGLGMAITAPALPGIGEPAEVVAPINPYHAISSLGNVEARSESAGGWGLVSAALATLLALTGPLELRDRKRSSTGRKDDGLFFRAMIFSLLFGGGVAWFITMQCMSEESFLPVFLTATSCMAVAFFGTVASVLGYFLNLDDFGEVIQICTVMGGAVPVFMLIAGASSLVEGASDAFGMGGWLSTYLSVCSMVFLCFAFAVRSRQEKNASSKSLGNTTCLCSWVCSIIVIYGKYGLADLDGLGTVMGVPISVVGTIMVAPILLALEGDSSESPSSRQRLRTVASSKGKGGPAGFWLDLKGLKTSNQIIPLFLGTISVFLMASIYAVFFRGSAWTGDSVAKDHEDVFRLMEDKSLDGEIASMTRKMILHNRALVSAARLSAAGFWTSRSLSGPLLHFGGVMAVLPGLSVFTSSMWQGVRMESASVILCGGLNLVPLLLCQGIPSLQAAAVICMACAIYNMLLMQKSSWLSKMRV